MGAGSRPAVAAARPAPAPARPASEPASPPPSRYTPPSIPVVPRFLAAPTPAAAPGYGTAPVEGPRELEDFSAPPEMSEALFSDPANPTPSLLLSMETATLDAPMSSGMDARMDGRLDGRLDSGSMQFVATMPGSGEAAAGGARRAAPRAAGRAGAVAPAEPEVDPEAGISDSEAFGALSAEWGADVLEPLPRLELEAASLPTTEIDLEFPQKPPPPDEEESGAKRRKEAEDQALHAATDAYRGLATAAHEHHDAVLSQLRNRGRELAERSESALAQVDRNLAPRVDALLSSIEAGRRQIADGADAAEATVDQQAAQARRAIGGAVIGARKRIDAASTAAAGQVPGINTGLRTRFNNTYSTFADEVKNSGAWAQRTLTGEAKKSAVRDAIPMTGDPAAQAMADAKRRVVPPRLDELGNGLKAEADAQERNIRARMTAAPPGGASISASIDAFTQSISDSIAGAGENKSLSKRGYEAVDKAQTSSLNTLHQQSKAAREAMRHARVSGEAQVALHRRSALQRLGSMRRTAREAMRAQAEGALKALQATAKASLPLYGDAVKRIDSTLRGALPGGAAGLSDAAKKAVPPVQRSLADGHRLQDTRINQVATGAERGVQGQGDRLLTESDKAAQEFELLMAGVAQGLSAQLMQMAQQQSAGFKGLSRGVSSASDSFCQPIPRQYADAIARQVATLNPVHTAEDAAVSAEARRTVDAQRGKVENPLPEIQAPLTAVANALDQALTSRKNAAWSALDHPIDIDENALMAAFRGLSGIQAASVEFKYNREHANLRARVQAEHDDALGGLNDAEYNSVMAALNGDPSAAAFYELQTTTHWYGNDGERAAAVVEGLSDDQRRTLTSYGNWGEIADSVRAGLPATELNVFNALADGNRARADAIRSREAIDRARAQHDDAALITATTSLGAVRNDRDALNPEATVPEAERRAAVQREFATLPGVRPAGAAAIADPSTLTPEQRTAQQTAAADALAAYATRTYSETRSDGEGGQYTVEFRVERTASTLVGAIARGGPDSVDARAARILYESERPGGDRPDTGALEGAVVDPRLNPTLTPNLTPAQRAAARQEQDQIFARYAELAAAHGVPGAPHNAEEARALASERLRLRYGDSESDRLGADYVHSVVTDNVPNPVIAMRFAMVGGGTNEELIHRTLQRHSRAQIAQLRTDYRREYGSDMFEDLGVYGRGSFGEVSGDDRLQTERELMGVPMNDRERAEVALFANQQQLNERGMLDVNEGSDEERALMRAQGDLRRMAGGNVVLDEFGRPSVEGGAFSDTGGFTGDADAFNRGLNTSQGSVDAYVARTDRIASYVTTGIAVLGAAIAAVVTVATGGLAAPLLMAGIAAATGLASIAANQMIRGGRYGWEQAAVDLGMTAIQAATAGIGAQLGAGAALAAKGAQAAGATAGQLTRMGLLSAARIGAITGGIGGLGNAALNERTWDKGIGSGLGLVLEGGLKGSLSGAVTGVVSSGLESLGRGGATIGDRMNGLTATGPMALANMAGRGLMRSGISSVSAMAGRGSELLFDSATGRFHGSRHAVLASLAEAGESAAIQGFFEGAGESIGGRLHAQTLQRRGAEIASERKRLDLPALNEQDLNAAASDLLLKERFADDPSSPEHVHEVARDGGWDPREFIASRARGRGAAADAAPSTRALPPAEDTAATALDAVKTAEEHNGEPPVPPPPTDTPSDSPEPPRRPAPTEAEAAEIESRRSQRSAESEDSFGDAEFDALIRDLKHSPFGYELEAGKRATPAVLPEDSSRTRAGVDHKAHADARANPPPGQEPGAQIQHWTKTLDVTRDLPAGMNSLHPDAINENISWLQSRKNQPSTLLHVDPEGGGTRIFVDEVPRGRTGDAGAPGEQLNLFEPAARPRQADYNTEHKFADAALIPAIAEQIADSRRRAGLPSLDPRELAIAAGEQARWVMSGESGSERSGKVIDVAAIASSHPAPDRAGTAPARNPNQLELDFNGPARQAAGSEAEAPRVRIDVPDEPTRVRIATDDEPTRVRIAVDDDGEPRVRVQLDEDADLAHQLDDLAAAQTEVGKPAARRLLAEESDAEGLRVRHPDADAEGIMPDGTLDPDEVLPIVDEATDAHAYPDAMAHIDLSGAEALASYRQSLADDMSREAGIYYDPVSDSYAVVQGRAFDVDPAVLFGDGGETGRWQPVEHYHPGLDVAARYPSPEDFKAMMHWQTHGTDSPHTVSSRILWIDAETGAEFHTIIGFKPGEEQPYYVQFRDHDGVEAHVTFRDPPWEANSDFKAFYQQEIEWATGSALAHVEDVANAPIPVLQAEIEAANAAAARAAAEADPEDNIDTGVFRRADLGLPDAERPPVPGGARAAPTPDSEPARIVPVPESPGDPSAPHAPAPGEPAEAPRARLRIDPPPEPVPPVHAVESEAEAQARLLRDAEDEAELTRLQQHEEREHTSQRRYMDEPAGEGDGRRGTADRTAGGIGGGSRFSGDAATALELPAAHMGAALDAAEALGLPGSALEGRLRFTDSTPDRPAEITLLGRTPGEPEIPVRLRMVDQLDRVDGERPAAIYREDPDHPGGYLVLISRNTPASELPRTLAHEFTEIRSVHGTDGKQVDGLGSGGAGRRPSPHDEGRMAEVEVMARQLAALDPEHPNTPATQRRLLDEAQRLADKLGLLGGTPAADQRLVLARRMLGDSGPGRALLDQAVSTAASNPFLQKPTGNFGDDLALLARRLRHVASLGDSAETVRRRQATIMEQAATLIARDGLVTTKWLGETATRNPTLSASADPRRIEAVRKTLPPELHDLFDQALTRARTLEPLRAVGSRAPTPGYEARYETEPVPRPGLEVPDSQKVKLGSGRNAEELTFEQAVERRQTLLDRQRQLRAEMNADGTSSTRRAELKAQVEELIGPINKLSESLGVAAGRRFISQDPELSTGRILELPRDGAGIPDLIVELPPHPGGRLVLVECKGGNAELGTRGLAGGRIRVEQGRREYLQSLVTAMEKSKNATIKAYGRQLAAQLAAGGESTDYYLVRQPFDLDGDPTTPEIGKFDVRR